MGSEPSIPTNCQFFTPGTLILVIGREADTAVHQSSTNEQENSLVSGGGYMYQQLHTP